MGKKKTSLLLAGLAAGAYAYLRKPENRDKALDAFNNTKEKVNDLIEKQKQSLQNKQSNESDTAAQMDEDSSVTGNVEKDYYLDEKDMVSEGALTSVQYYNDEAQERLDARRNRDYKIGDQGMVSEGALTKVKYENAEAQEKLDEKQK